MGQPSVQYRHSIVSFQAFWFTISMLKVSKCCCCIELRTGAIVLASLGLVGSLYYVIRSVKSKCTTPG